jgi:hypothetical protein
MGRAAGGGPAAHGAWANSNKDAIAPQLSGPRFVHGADQAQENQHNQHRDTGCGNHRRPRSRAAGFT